jgi:hypothetical protein
MEFARKMQKDQLHCLKSFSLNFASFKACPSSFIILQASFKLVFPNISLNMNVLKIIFHWTMV